MSQSENSTLTEILETPWRTVVRLQTIGASLCVIPAVLGVMDLMNDRQWPSYVYTFRLLMLAVGMLLGAIGISLRPMRATVWLFGTAIAFMAAIGLPMHWDSIRILARAMTGICLFGALAVSVAPGWRYAMISLFVVFHVGSLYTAVTRPGAAPWSTNQLTVRVYMPYQNFMYLSNAYHFYSPEPGPAHHMYFLLKYEKDGKIEQAWIDLPNRRDHFRDPLGLTYYRRLSITELVASSVNANQTPMTQARFDATNRRRQIADKVPLTDIPENVNNQYQLPPINYAKHMFPSYARHIFAEYSTGGRKVLSVKMFKVQHRVIPIQYFKSNASQYTGVITYPGNSPYHPSTYYPYYLGEFDANGDLINPEDPMLYWLIPIIPANNAAGFEDYMSKYSGSVFEWPQK